MFLQRPLHDGKLIVSNFIESQKKRTAVSGKRVSVCEEAKGQRRYRATPGQRGTALPRQDVVGVGQLALLSGGNAVSVAQRQVAVGVMEGGKVLPVAGPGHAQAQQGAHQHVLPVVFVVAGPGDGDQRGDE